MRKTIKTAMLICLAFLTCALVFTACKGDDNSHVHTFGEWITIKDSTCTESGVQFRKCITCDEEENEYIKPSHKWTDATCLSVKECELCGATEGGYADHQYQTGMCIWCGTFDPNGADNLTYDGSEVTLQFLHPISANNQKILNDVITEFNKLYPNIKIDPSQCSGSQILDTFSTVSTVFPTVAVISSSYMWESTSEGWYLPLDTLIASTSQITRADGTTEMLGLTEAQRDNYCYFNTDDNGTHYSLPFNNTPLVLYYDKEFFAQHNLTVPTTWDEMEAVCEAIKKIDPSGAPLGISDNELFVMICEQMGADYRGTSDTPFAFNGRSVAECVSLVREWYQKGYITTQEINGIYNPGKYMDIDYANLGKYVQLDGVAPIPQMNSDNSKTPISRSSFFMSKTNDSQEAIAMWLFIKYLSTNEEFQAEYSMSTGSMPSVKSVFEDPIYSEWMSNANDITASSIKVAYRKINSYFNAPAWLNTSDVRGKIALMISECLTSNGTGDIDAFIQEKLNKTVQECNKVY